ncbi:MAG: hypothetical protein E7289_02615 [Lachnospiraceae bacterium]|nr:hypothetical protein [Lachnospiraceae bacterium]
MSENVSATATYENAIEIRNLTKKYDGFTLDDISFSVPKGSIMGFIGQNGTAQLVARQLKKYNLIYFTLSV